MNNRCFLPVYREYYVLSNDNASRGFICLPVEDRAKQLGRLIPVIDEVLRSFNQPAYYEVRYLYLISIL
jgi:hypothetical protein